MSTFFLNIVVTNFFYLILGKFIMIKFFEKDLNNITSAAILGVISASFLALTINFILPLNILINSIFYIVIILAFLFAKVNLTKKDYFFIAISSVICFLIILYDYEYRPDAGLYHIPYTHILNESKIIVGLANLHSRFGHISIFQYLAAFNVNIITKEPGILIPLASIISFLYIYFFNDILKLLKKKESFSFGKIFSLLIIIYISYKINRYSEFGNDAPAHLFLFYIVSRFIYLKDYSLKNTNLIYFYCVFAFLSKIFFIFIFLITFHIFSKNIKNFKGLLISFPTLVLFLWILKNILISGCLIFPMENSCFPSLKWTNMEFVKHAELEGEAWSKAWPQNYNSELHMKEFVEDFNWVKAWSSIHLKYIIKILSPFIIIMVSIFMFLNFRNKFRPDNKSIVLDDKKYLTLMTVATLGVLSFFLIYPIYRYGYSYIILFLFLVSTKIFRIINEGKFLKISKIMFSICLVSLISKQLLRIYNHSEQRNYIPSYIFVGQETLTNLMRLNKFEIINIDNYTVYYSNNECYYSLAPCTSYKQNTINLRHEKKFTYNILYNK
jgi:hypothetical protein